MTQGTPPKGGKVGLRFNALHVNILFLSMSGGVSNGRRFS